MLRRSQLAQRVGGVADLALAGQEHQDVAVALALQLARRRRRWRRAGRGRGRRPGRRGRRPAGSGPPPGSCARTPRRSARACPMAVAKCSANRSGSMVAEVMITLRSGRLGQQLGEVAQDEVDVEAALVRLVDDQRVVLAEHPVAGQLGQQDAVGHQLDQRVVADLVGEPHLPADRARRARCRSSSAIRAATVRAASRRGWVCPIMPRTPAAELEADLRAAGWSSRSRSRRRRSRPGGRGWRRRCRRGGR